MDGWGQPSLPCSLLMTARRGASAAARREDGHAAGDRGGAARRARRTRRRARRSRATRRRARPPSCRRWSLGLPDNDEAEEYRRIPWIWRVAVAAGRAKDEASLKPLTDVSMPKDGERLRDWQAVVLGGGVVMGLSQAGTWPRDVMAPWLADDATRASAVGTLARSRRGDGRRRRRCATARATTRCACSPCCRGTASARS